MLLKNKTAIIYGAGGSLGSTVAQTFAREGAYVFVTGRSEPSIKRVADQIVANGDQASYAVVDALDEKAVNDHINEVVEARGRVDISFNLIGLQDLQGIALTDMKQEDYLRPVRIAMQTQFLTTTAAGRVMIRQGSGVILSLTATPGGMAYPLVGGFGPACCAIEGYSRDLASELGPKGVRVVNIRSAGSPDSRVFVEALSENEGAADFVKNLEADTMLKRLPVMKDIASIALMLASDLAAGITGTTIDVTCGTTEALNANSKEIAFVYEK